MQKNIYWSFIILVTHVAAIAIMLNLARWTEWIGNLPIFLIASGIALLCIFVVIPWSTEFFTYRYTGSKNLSAALSTVIFATGLCAVLVSFDATHPLIYAAFGVGILISIYLIAFQGRATEEE